MPFSRNTSKCDLPVVATHGDSRPGSLPVIIQGGLGVAVSNWRLAREVSSRGQLGVVSGTAIDQVLVRRLQDGDPGSHMRRGLDHFPCAEMAERIWQKYYIPNGKVPDEPYRLTPIPGSDTPRALIELRIVANFVEVYLAREEHNNAVGINYMEKLQSAHLASIYGAMLAGVSYVLMGAGIPMRIPGVLDRFSQNEPASYPLTVTGARADDEFVMWFDPREFIPESSSALTRPTFLAIVSSNVLASALVKKANGRVDGFVIEGPTAGGHNAPPRGELRLNDFGEPVYGERDHVDLAKIKALGRPFWLAGGFGSSEGLHTALSSGAAGIQVGTAFAFCNESGMRDDYKKAVITKVRQQKARVFTDPFASPSGFPFKLASLEGTISEDAVCRTRPKVCDLGFLREAYRQNDGQIGYRCPAESAELYANKGGADENALRKKCLCNALMATAGHPQIRGSGYIEPGVITAGDDLPSIERFLAYGKNSYSAADVLTHLLSGTNKTFHGRGSDDQETAQ